MKQGIKSWHLSDCILLAAYAVWIGIGLVTALFRVNEAAVQTWPLPGFILYFISCCLQQGDLVLILLAAANTHWMIVRIWEEQPARRWFYSVVIAASILETIGTLTGFPFGSYSYTENFGLRIGPLPVAIPLAWYVLVSNALVLWRSLLPGFILTIEAAVVATLVTAIDWVMEPFASKIKVYWLWNDSAGKVPPHNYIAWWVAAFLLVHLFAKSPAHQDRFEPRPIFILGTMVLLFVLTRRAYGL